MRFWQHSSQYRTRLRLPFCAAITGSQGAGDELIWLVCCHCCSRRQCKLNSFLHCRARGEKAPEDEAMKPQAKLGSKAAENPKDMPPVIIMDED